MQAQLPPVRLAQAIFSVALFLLAAAPHASADTYSLTTVRHTQSENFIGIDGAGNFSINVFDSFSFPGANCGGTINPHSCFETFYAGSSSPVFTTSAPALAFDNGSTCKPAVDASFFSVNGICNNGHYIISAIRELPGAKEVRGIWGGPNPDPIADLLGSGMIQGGFMNSLGDAVFINSLNDTLVFADDLSTDALSTSVTPEPSSLLLLATGGLTLFGALKRRQIAR